MGEQVEAYDPTTHATSVQTVQHVFVDHDTDLLDVTLRTLHSTAQTTTTTTMQQPGRVQHHAAAVAAESSADPHDEIVHTTASHPWLTADYGWQRAGVLSVGEPVVTADGSPAVVVALRVVPGAADMWDLTVSNMHTFVVGSGAYVVHNCPPPGGGGSGGQGSQNPLQGIQYTPKVQQQMKLGDFHSFPGMVDNYGALGTTRTIIGSDGVARTLVEIPGGYMGRDGVFQYIIEPDGVTVNHRLFVPY